MKTWYIFLRKMRERINMKFDTVNVYGEEVHEAIFMQALEIH